MSFLKLPLKPVLDKFYAAKEHLHGNVTDDGKIEGASNKNVVTDANGKITTENKPTIPSASSTTPSADTTNGSVGSGTTWAKADHTHPKSTIYSSSDHNHDGTYLKTGTGTVTSTNIANKTIVNEDISDSANIAFAKLNISKNDITGLGIPASDTNTTYTAATQSADGLMSSSDKTKLDGIATGANKTTVDSSLSSSSTNPVQNKVINTALSGKAASTHNHTKSEITDFPTDATTSTSGLMSSTDKTKLDGIATSANNYSHPSYTARTGKPTANQTPAFGGTATVSQITSDATGHVTGATDRTITIPSSTAVANGANGLMTGTDKAKLDGIATGANKTTVDSSMSSSSTNPVQNKIVKSAIDAKTITVDKQATAESGYIATYVVKQNGTQVGEKINIPKDFLVKSASLKTCTTANSPLNGLAVNDPYLDFIVNVKEGTAATDEHIYINVKDLVDTYTNGTGLDLSNNTFSVKYGTAAGTACQGNDSRLSNARTPTAHATTATTYGVGTTSNYGHNKLVENLTTDAGNGLALGAGQGKALKGMIDDISSGSIADSSIANSKLADQTNTVTEYIVGTQTASTSAWTGKATKISSLAAGQVIYYKLPYASTSTAVTLNLTLSNGTTTTGAKNVFFWNGQRLTTHYGVNSVIGLVYNGSEWWVINPSSNANNNNYYLVSGVQIINGETTAISNGNIIGGKSNGKYYKLASGVVLDVSYPLVEANGTINASTSSADTVSNNIQLVHPFLTISNIGMSTGTITANYPLYLEGTYNRGQFTVSAIVCDNATHSTLTNGKNYIKLGTTYDATHFRFVSNMTVYRYDSSAGYLVPIGSSYTDLANKPSTFTPSSHTHGNITNDGKVGTTATLPLITGTGGVVQAGSFGTAAGTFCQGNDSRLSNARTPTSHTHGNITNAGAIGSTANLPIITDTNGVLKTGSFGTAANTFCQGNDSRLSNTRTPTDGTVTTAKIVDKAVTDAKLANYEYINGTQTASTSAWTGITTKLTSTTIPTGTIIYYRLNQSSTSTNATLELKLSSDNTKTTGAKAVYLDDRRVTTHFRLGSIIPLRYDGTNWIVISPYTDSNTTYTAASATPIVDSYSGTVGTSVKYAREDHAHPHFDFRGMKGTDNTTGYVKCLQLKPTATYQDKPIAIEIFQRDRTEKTVVQIKYSNANSTDPGLQSITHTGQNINVYLYKSATSTWELICSKGHSEKYGEMVVKIDNPNTGITITSLDTHIASLPTSNITTSTYIGFTSAEKTKLAGIATSANNYSHPSGTAKTGNPDANKTPAFGSTFTVTQFTSDSNGHITGATDRTVKIPNALGNGTTAGLSTNDYTTTEKNKLAGIATSANNYSHPSTHAASMITDATKHDNIGSVANDTQATINTKIDTALSGKANKTNGASQITDNNSANYEAIEGEASETQQSLNSKINEHIAQLQQDTSNLVPTDHSSSGQNYGLATASKYGHAKIVTNLTTADADGLVLGAGQGKALKTAVDGKAPTSHTNTGNTATYGKATASVWGHTKAGSVVTADSIDGDVGTDNGFYARATHKHKKSDLYAEASHNHTMSDITDWLNKVYPIGSIYMNATSDKNPSDSSLLGVGTWVQIGQGRMLLGAGTYEETVDGTTQTKTYTGGSTDGSKNAIVVSHHHNAANNTQFISGQDGSIGRTSKRAFVTENSGGIRYLYDTGTSITDSCCTTDQGVDGTDMNMPPYLVVYMWKRTA